MIGEAGYSCFKRFFLLSQVTDRKMIFIAIVLLLTLTLFQLDPGPAGPVQHYPDSEAYLSVVNFFESGSDFSEHSIRTTRILSPFIVSIIPMPAHSAFLVLNLLFI